MKKLMFIVATVGITLPGIAQDKYVVSANLELKHQNYDEAKAQIDKAMENPTTSKKPKALFAKAQIYFTLQNQDKYKSQNPYEEGLKAAMELVKTKADYEKEFVDQLLLQGGFLTYNDGVKAYNNKDYDKAVALMKRVSEIYELGAGGKRFSKLPENFRKQLDTVAADAYLTMANSVYYSGDMKAAIPLLVTVKNNPIRRVPSVYQCLIDAYNKENETAKEKATIDEARKLFPQDVTIRNYELNYYIKAGKLNELISKLEEAAAKDPGNADIQFNIATTYLSMAGTKDGKKPANAPEMYSKSEKAFMQAVKLAPENAGYNYNFGALYFNQATDVNDEINAITGSSKADQDKYDNLKAKRNSLFSKATPYFEKAYSVLDPKASTLKGEELQTYKSTLVALNRIYAILSQLDKATAMKAKLDALK